LTARIIAETSRLGEIQRRLGFAIRQRLGRGEQRVEASEGRLAAMGYRSVLSRGFSITRTKRGKQVLRSVREATEGDKLVTELADGTIESKVTDGRQPELFD